MSASTGWNDPPQVAYSITNTVSTTAGTGSEQSASRGKTLLNKRVPFPVNGPPLLMPAHTLSTATSDCPSGSGHGSCAKVKLMPPTDAVTLATASALHVSAPIDVSPSVTSNSSLGANVDDDDDGAGRQPEAEASGASLEDLHKETLESLRDFLNLCLPTLQTRTSEDIAKRLTVLSNMWIAGKLNEDVQLRMHRLTSALHKRNHDEANNIHLALIVDHVSQVSPWMVGIKHLIHETRHLSTETVQKESPIIAQPPPPPFKDIEL